MRTQLDGLAFSISVLAILAVAASPAEAQPDLKAQYSGRAVELIRRYPAEEARQGVAVDRDHIYAVANSTIAKYDKKTGAKLVQWRGDPVRFPHINSCAVVGRRLVCANSNYPGIPQLSSVEFFDPKNLRHLRTVPLGRGMGSLTWVDRKGGAWWAGFANYDGKGGEPPRDHRNTILVRFDDNWRRIESWSFPKTILDRFKPASTSGGGWGPDERLYVTGHDRKELYVLALPQVGGVLDHLATLEAPIEGQAIDWDESQAATLYGVSRSNREIVAMRIPLLTPAPTTKLRYPTN